MANTKYTHAIVSRVPEVFAVDKRVRVYLETVPKKMRLANKDVNSKKFTILIQIA